MTCNSPIDNDFDFDASVSSVNSDSEKVDNSLIKRILSEMKSEFNRGTPSKAEDSNENDNETEDVLVDHFNYAKLPIEETNVKHGNSDDEDSGITPKQNTSNILSGVPAITVKKDIDSEEETADYKPRLILTLRTNEEDREISCKLSTRSNVPMSFAESSLSVVDKSDKDDKGSTWESKCRRSLRSSSRLTDKESEHTNMKRSSRRFSKEQCRESVLQNAIARKEKSFSSFNQPEERSTRRGARSPRQSSGDSKSSRSMSRSKSPKALIVDRNLRQDISSATNVSGLDSNNGMKQASLSDTNMLVTIKSETDLISIKSENYDLSEDSNDTTNVNSASTNSQTSELSDLKPMKTNKMYTKTGKRRAKYFKGLKYSLTTGGSVVRKKTLNVTKKGRKKIQGGGQNVRCTKMIYKSEQNIAVNCGDNDLTTENEVQNCERDRLDSIKERESFLEDDESSVSSSSQLVNDKEKLRSGSPVLGNVCLSTFGKRKYQPDIGEPDIEKRCCRVDVPSPCQGDVEIEPDKPEATAITLGVGSAGVCLCNSTVAMYAKTTNSRAELYCLAVDSLDGRLIGCCNTVGKDDARLLRPSSRVPFLVLCDVHHDRLQRHNCCPGCGIFCTQGKFMQCWAYHQYHQDCQLSENGKEGCPHCGSEESCEVTISLGAHKYPVFFPLQKPPKKMPSAKMTFTYSSEVMEDKVDYEMSSLIPADALVLPSGLQITSQGLPASLDKDKLEDLLHVACSLDIHSLPRYTLRNMYQAAKNGDAEKMVHMLDVNYVDVIAAGLNPNHVFREWGLGSALHAACHGGHLSVVHLLLQAGADPDTLDRDQNTPLMLACAAAHNPIVKYLVKAGASVTLRGGDGMTALHLAAKSGNVEACHYLISNHNTPRSFIDSVDDGRWTPLVWAAEHKHYDVVKFLLGKRADPLVRDAEQNIALHWAALSGSIDISEALLNYGSDVNSTNAHADTPLHIAARQNAYECVILLLARGARVDMHNRAGVLPLDCVVGAPNDTYNAIKLNVELRNLTLNVQKRAQKILTKGARVDMHNRAGVLYLDCVVGAPNDTYNAIKLNVELRNLTLNVQKRAQKILTNDITRGHEANPVQCINGVDVEPEPQDFVYITKNCFTSNINVDRTITSLQSCKCQDVCVSGGCMCGKISFRCWYDDEGKLLPEFNFADPPMLFECNQACTCNWLTCKNRVVQHGITARFQLFRTKGNKGWGVRTLRLIPKGAYVCEYVGEIISDCEADTREDDSYLFDLDNRDGETYCIDARKYGNIARFINHSCSPNLLPVRVFIEHQDLHFPRIAFFANKDIPAYEELGFDYGEKFWIIKSKLFTCTCGAEKCKYSDATIEKTLADYNKKIQQEENR